MGGVVATATQLFFSALVLVDNQLLFPAHMRCQALLRSKVMDNEAPLAHAHQLLQCGINATIDSPADSELWTFHGPRAMSWQHKRFGTALLQYLTYHYATQVLP